MRVGIELVPLLLLSCAPEPQPGKGDPDDTPTPVDSDPYHEDTDHPPMVDARRPLCKVEATPAPLAPDLAAWVADTIASEDRYYGEGRWRELEALGESVVGSDEERAEALIERGWFRLKFGDMDGAMSDLQIAEQLTRTDVVRLRKLARMHLAAAWMRRAELDNCIANGSAAACLVPFSEEALHVQQEGMTHAAELLTALLEEDDPNAWVQRWLLNVAHMALGTWPDGVPEAWRVPEENLTSESSAPEWPNVAHEVGLTEPDIAGSSSINDFDGDGLLDLMSSSADPSSGMTLWLNQGDGRFCDASVASGLTAIPGVLGFSVIDYDNDGDLDALAPRAAWMKSYGLARLSLLRNDGNGRFTDVAVEAGMGDVVGPSQTSAWADVDGDGWLDAYVGRESLEVGGATFSSSSLYMNQRDGTFRDVAPEQGLDRPGQVKGAAFGDIDHDGDQDLFLSIMGRKNLLYRNEGGGVWRDVSVGAGVDDPMGSFSAWFFDYDQDGDDDIFCAAYPHNFIGEGPLSPNFGRSVESYACEALDVIDEGGEWASLYRNDGPGRGFVDVSESVSLDDFHATMGSNFGDMNMDGWPDMYLGTGAPSFDALEPNAAYLNLAGARFADITTVTHTGHLQKGHGVAFGDLDEDGDEDILADIGGAYRNDAFPNALFLNPTTGKHGVTLRLEGVASNRSAVGARVRVIAGGRTFHHVVGATSSFGSNSLQIEAGLGDAAAIDRVEIEWPAGSTEALDAVPIDQIVAIREGSGVVATRPLLRMPMGEGHHAP
ncbi:MAG TPA: CRTAC1 family protein [Myxococcota bacterium]|nr:CRTAC1 family protein [Myxococcota bacterium]